ncbi:hypothetical protein IOD16_27060 [Saccharothrix sp. 6-C]|uniref:hypothetical protein n=1 Tax=Saccharothrix sp. 6-C TaxID=2781735 RepID=UPI00191755A6|nr:hypothetical protein [Saccharothrix sp. 6-C]QQQ74775.1 hypothetical protein IOD16_27060 [Saccharothrix sp. 6-C]
MTGTNAVQEPDRPGLQADLARVHGKLAELTFDDSEPLETTVIRILSEADRVIHRERRPCRPAIINGLAARYGLLGQPPSTLEKAGLAMGVTRERARQIQKQHEALYGLHLWWPQLDAALELVKRLAPCADFVLADELIRRGITTIRYSLDSLRACAEFAGRPFDLEVKDGVVTDDPDTLTAVYRATRRLAERQGLATLLQVSDEALDSGVVVTEDDVRALLAASESVVWLNEDHVTWASSARNRLVNTLRTLLSVHQPVDLSSARQAVENFWAYRNSGHTADQADLVAPTITGLRAFCEWHEQFALDGNEISATVPLDANTELGVEAALLVELIRMSPNGVLDRTSLMETAEAFGMNLSTVGLYLTFHPAFVQLDRNVWTVRGTQVASDMVATVQRQARARSLTENRDFRAGVTSNDCPWVMMAVTSNFRLTGVLLRRWLPAGTPSTRFELIDGRGEPCGTAAYNNETGFTHGFGIYVRRFGLQVGEYVYICADPDEETARIVHGGSDEVRRLVQTNLVD